MMKKIFLIAFLAIIFFSNEESASSSDNTLKIVVLPVKMAIKVKELKEIDDQKAKIKEENKRIVLEERLKEITKETTLKMKEYLSMSQLYSSFECKENPETNFFDEKYSFPKEIEIEKIRSIKASNADLIMLSKISAYGKVKKEWIFLLVGSGILEGIVHGFIASKATGSGVVAVGVALEEIITETLKWGGGAYFFGRQFNPVILETRLYSAKSGKMVFKANSIAIARKKFFKKSDIEKRSRRYRLKVVSEKAIEEIIKKLSKNFLKIKSSLDKVNSSTSRCVSN